MVAGYLDLIKSDLVAVEKILIKALKIKPGTIEEFAHIEDDYLSKNFYPATILLAGRFFNLTGKKIVSLAAIIEFVYLAALVHFRVSEDSPDLAGTELKDGSQYPVLVGDYLYGSFFTTLCEGDVVHLLEPLAQVICEMNLGGILRTQNFSTREQKLAVLEKESGYLLAEGCRLVGELAEVSKEDLDNLRNFGYNIGMGYGLLERDLLKSEAGDYLTKGLEIINFSFPEPKTQEVLDAKEALTKLITALQKGHIKAQVKKYGKHYVQKSKLEDNKYEGNLEFPGEYRNKEEYVQNIFSKIAGRYDFLNTVLSLNRDKYWRKFTVKKAGLEQGDSVLDVCCGTGMISTELAKVVGTEGNVVGLDFCGEMLDIARENLKDSPNKDNIKFIQGDAMDLPFDDNSFDCTTIGYGLRNVPDVDKVLKEMMRVVKPGGRVVSLEFAKPTVPVFKQIYNFYFDKWVPFLGKLGAGIDGPYRYLHKSWTVFPHQKEVRDIFRRIGLVDTEYFELTGGVVAVHVGTKPLEESYDANVAAATDDE